MERNSTANSDANIFEMGLKRILLMTYFPSGFWSRLITRLLADEQLTEAIKSAYVPSNNDVSFLSFFHQQINRSEKRLEGVRKNLITLQMYVQTWTCAPSS